VAISAAVITIEGVLQKVVSYAPIPSGLNLYHGLASVFRVILVSDYPKDEVDRWLNLEGLTKHGVVLYANPILESKTASEKRLAQLSNLRSRGFAIDFCIEPDPVVASAILASGISVLNFLHFAYALPQWRPDYDITPKPWAAIEEEAQAVALLRAKDTKLKQIEDTYN
jgi:hypothetical protein